MDENLTPRPRWFQFTVGRVLGATSWMGVCFSVFAVARPQNGRPPSGLLEVAVVLLFFVALGTLFGHPVRGLLLGVAFLIAVWVALVVVVLLGGLTLPNQ
jgi:hypothetical protein